MTHTPIRISDLRACNKVCPFRFFFSNIYGGWNGHMEVSSEKISEGPCTSCTKVLQSLCRVSCTQQRSIGCFWRSKRDMRRRESCRVFCIRGVSFWWSLDLRLVFSWFFDLRIISTFFNWLVCKWKSVWYVCHWWNNFRIKSRLRKLCTCILHFFSQFL